MEKLLSKKDNAIRKFVLEGNMWKVVLSISMPLAIYNSFNHLFSFFDALMASHIGAEVVSAVSYLSQIKIMIAAVGGGLAVGGGIVIARYYGAGDIEKAKNFVNSLMFLAITIGILLLVLILPFTSFFLRLFKTPEELIAVGTNYFIIELIMIVSMFINNVYFAVEKAKGNTNIVLKLNILVMFVKIVLTSTFVYVLNYGVTMMAVATLITHLMLTVIVIYKYEYYGVITLAITASSMGFLYGLGYTRLSVIINFSRLFLFRLPTLYILMKYTKLGSESLGIAMLVSNGMVGVVAIIVAYFAVRNLKKIDKIGAVNLTDF